MIQEPWIHQDRVCGLKLDGYNTLYKVGTVKPRACIMVKNTLNVFILSDYSDKDTVTVAMETNRRTIWLASCYMAHDHGTQPPNTLVRKFIRAANRTNMPAIICADANAHHTVWGSSDINTRGESLFDFILSRKLAIANIGTEPTFIVSNRREVLDITLISDRYTWMIKGWNVSKECSLSDHQYIDFLLDVSKQVKSPYTNRRRTDWDRQSDALSRLLPCVPPVISDTEDIEKAVDMLTKSLSVATSTACKPTIRKGKSKPPWWNSDIANARSACRNCSMMQRGQVTGLLTEPQ